MLETMTFTPVTRSKKKNCTDILSCIGTLNNEIKIKMSLNIYYYYFFFQPTAGIFKKKGKISKYLDIGLYLTSTMYCK